MPERLRVLVVDDEPLQLELLERSLSLEGCEVCVSNAAIGTSALVRNFQPDVVLLDVNIPALSGDKLSRGARDRWRASTVRRCRRRCSRASCSVVKRLRALCLGPRARGTDPGTSHH